MLLRIGVIAMSFSVVLALVLVAIVVFRDKPEEVVAAESAASSPQPKTDEEFPDPRDKMLDLPSPEPRPAPQPKPQSETKSQSKSEPGPQPKPEPVSKSESAPAAPAPETKHVPKPKPQSSLPEVKEDWPLPDSGELEAANEPRAYDWTPGTIMTLTVKSIGLHNAPVINSDGQQALDNGVVHVPGTSMPWTRSPQRNVYLAGHRLGWPGTGSRLIFYNLDKLKSGDEVILRDRRDRRYRYRVSNIFVVGPYESWVTGQIRNRDMVTFQTCTGPNFSKRLIVRADRV